MGLYVFAGGKLKDMGLKIILGTASGNKLASAASA